MKVEFPSQSSREICSRLPVPSPTAVIGGNWNTALGCQAVRKILNEIKTPPLEPLLFLAAARGAAAVRLSMRLSACGSAAESCSMSALRPRGRGWNILHLKWPYFQAAHSPKRSSATRDGEGPLETPGRAPWAEPAGRIQPWKGG